MIVISANTHRLAGAQYFSAFRYKQCYYNLKILPTLSLDKRGFLRQSSLTTLIK